jgi:hypothetical protein
VSRPRANAKEPPLRSPVSASHPATGRTGSQRYTARRIFAELLIDCEEDRVLRAVIVGMLREADCLVRNERRLGSDRHERLQDLATPGRLASGLSESKFDL